MHNLLSIYQALSQQSQEQIEEHFASKGYGALKLELADMLVATLEPIQERYAQLSSDKHYLQSILDTSLERVRPIAKATYQRAKELVGLV